jgi:hypothetical protein
MEKIEDKIDIKRYEYLVNARNFNYTNFNVWMAFFVVIIGGIFAGYCTLLEKKDAEFECYILLIAGYIISLFWHLSCKGYYYWITNFIQLICKCEEKLDNFEKIYYCFADKNANNDYTNIKKGANISTSVMVCMLSYLTAIIWAVMFIYKLLHIVIPEICTRSVAINMLCVFASLLLGIIITKIFMLVVQCCKCFHSNIDDHVDLELLEKQRQEKK